MAYEQSILQRANARLLRRRESRERRRYDLERELYEKAPELRKIDREIRGAMVDLADLALGGRPVAADGPEVSAVRQRSEGLQRKRAEIMKALGYEADALDEKPFCPRCGDTGWLSGGMCACLQQLCADEQMRELTALMNLSEEQSFARLRLDVYSDGLWQGVERSPRENMKRVVLLCQRYAEQFPNYQVKNLLFSGGTGLGKTFLSGCIAREVSQRGFSVVYDTAINVFSGFETRKFSRDAEEERQARADTRRYLNCDLLILDDLGSELTTPMVQTALYDLVNSRLQADKRTIISTNLSMEHIAQRYSPQVVSRIGGLYRELTFYGEDIRQKML